ncbi:DNA/RNA helicases, SNF2 family [hydrothermal vent metagenome]|uniref:DNA/RNA helicases, SNF2 family n=1 Tax=hydrothermal vent metagenome TaxID=652676 RepID=A0A3B0XXH8_9ZZZZ
MTQKKLSTPQIEQRYEASAENIQHLLQLVAVIYEPVPVAKLYKCVNLLSIKDSDGKQYTHKKLQTTLEYLSARGLLEKIQNKYCVNDGFSERLCRLAQAENCFSDMVMAARNIFPLSESWRHVLYKNPKQCFREIRIAIYADDIEATNNMLQYYVDAYQREFKKQNPVCKICFMPFDNQWLSALSNDMLSLAIHAAFTENSCNFANIDNLLQWLMASFSSGYIKPVEQLAFMCAGQYMLRGDMASANVLSQFTDDYHRLLLHGWKQFIQGENEQAIGSFETAIAMYKKVTRKRKVFINNISGLFFILALIKSKDPQRLQQAHDYSKIHFKQKHYSNPVSHHVLSQLLNFLLGKTEINFFHYAQKNWKDFNSTLGYLLYCYSLYWSDKDQAIKLAAGLKKYAHTAENNGDLWLAYEAWQLLAKIASKNEIFQSKADTWHQQQKSQSIINIIKPKEKWEQALDALAMFQQHKSNDPNTADTRIVWFISGLDAGFPDLQAKEQKRTAKGGWTKGRNLSLRRLKEEPESFTNLCSQDNAVRDCIIKESYGFHDDYGSYDLDESAALYALAGHPQLFDGNAAGKRLELIKAEPEVHIQKQEQQLFISMKPALKYVDIVITQETSNRWKVFKFSPQHRQLSELISDGLKVPLAAKDRVLASMSAIAPLVNIHSDIGGELGELESVEADSRLHVLLSPSDEGIVIESHCRVFGDRGPYYPPGEGSETIISEIDGKRLQTQRNLSEERRQLDVLLENCTALAQQENTGQHWFFSDPEDCLEILSELQAMKDNLTIAWPKGETLRIKQQLSMNQLSLNIQSKNDWFSASGELQLDDGEVLNMRRLLALSENSRGRFIKLEDGQFLALSETFSKRLQELRMFGELKGDDVQLHPLAALSLEGMGAEAGKFKAGTQWKAFSQRFEEAMNLQPELPSTLQAELRDYQQDGFCWLAKLAHWGAGACLADDMGLGKTLQAIALILHRTMNGPSLVIAPTSVALNWVDEIRRFAPTLNIIDFRESAPEICENLQAFDVVISSYGLLQNRLEQLEKVDWQAIVLDEAQAIKNPATKRSKATMKLHGQFKLITTGTPIENHLGELWNLFRFINPGLLGSLERFNQRFALPISRDNNPDASLHLKKLIQPFILRRTKAQVLSELPARTEIVLSIEMSQAETSLYEALRREAVEKFSTDSTAVKKGHRQLQILAEITKLRRACCNPQLIMKQGAPESSKLKLFAETVDELLDNHHKALVFSQFVMHLQLLEQHLKDRGIRYQYLDGSTTAKERRKRVNAFQAGEGDIFLISLKAGGVGLNLTAADYVIHMDPWWNPAVEDQASDRAHRIGQTRPVTVYRMVMKNTIEEKIIALHSRKRDLADNLLAGTDVADKLNAEDLLDLLKEE